ncbi:hypothetical protein QCM80_42485, partial [Bradyrhizobium sp. SSUT112]|uniref:hypothetical protein n=1 Tax=Bradyrhizobium sp. SSUT112 TaxID=3040604 RepID=UPI002446A95B
AGCGRNDRGSPSSTWAPLQIRTASLESQTIPMIQDVLGQTLSFTQYVLPACVPSSKTSTPATNSAKSPKALEPGRAFKLTSARADQQLFRALISVRNELASQKGHLFGSACATPKLSTRKKPA